MKPFKCQVFIFLMSCLFIFCVYSSSACSSKSFESSKPKKAKLSIKLKLKNDKPVIRVYTANFENRPVDLHYDSSVEGESKGQFGITLPIFDSNDVYWGGSTVIANCTGNFPVVWEYLGPSGGKVDLINVRRAPDINDPSSYSFDSVLSFAYPMTVHTGKYRCKSLKEPSMLYSDVYFYVPGKHVLLGDKTTRSNDQLSFAVPLNENQVVLHQCAVSDPNAKVTLFRATEPQGEFEKVKIEDWIQYNPQRGFIFDLQKNEDVWGNYLCYAKSEKGRTDETFVKVTKHEHSNNSKKAPTYFKVDKDKGTISCCGKDSEETLTLKHSRCDSVNSCMLSKAHLQGRSCMPKVTVCEVKQSFKTKSDENDEVCLVYENYEHDRTSMLLECSYSSRTGQKDTTSYLYFSYDMGDLLTQNDQSPPQSQILKIASEKIGEGKSRYHCVANKFFFSHDIQWGVVEKSGEQVKIIETGRPLIEIDDSKYKTVYCFAPVWNSPTEWRNVTLQVS